MQIRFHKENKKTYLGIGGFLALLLVVSLLLNWRMEDRCSGKMSISDQQLVENMNWLVKGVEVCED